MANSSESFSKQCPCCDYVSLLVRGGYDICPICYWEDDGQDVDNLDVVSPGNHNISLRKARINFTKYGACIPRLKIHVLPESERNNFVLKRRTILTAVN